MNIQAIFSHMFVKRSFFGLIAYAWGFMLGGSVLMTALTYGLALVGLSRYAVTLSQIAVLVMLLLGAWEIMELEYQHKGVTNVKSFMAAFLVGLIFGAMMPVAYAFAAFVTCRNALRDKASRTTDKLTMGAANKTAIRQRRLGLTAFMQDLMDWSFLKLAH